MLHVKQFKEIDLKDKEIIGYLRRGKGAKRSKAKPLKKKFENRISEMKKIAKDLIDPKAIYKIFDTSELPFRSCFEDAERVAIALVTIGNDLPNETNKLMDNGEFVDGVILDAIGSAGAEMVANLVNEEINQVAQNMNLNFSRRYSPGYCQWDVKDQKMIFQQLPANEIGVSLSESNMMSPIKSVSFAVNLGKDISDSGWENRCKFCDIGDCSYRMG